MKGILLIMMFCVGVNVFAQEISVDLDNFTQAEVTNGLKVKFTQSNENRATITGSSRDKVEFTVEKGVLTVKMALNNLWNEDNTVINVFYNEIQRIEARQNSKVEFCGKIKQPFIRLRAQEGADIKANLEVENIVASAVTGGNLAVHGIANNQEIEIKAAGDFKGENLIGQNVEISIIGGGTANVFSNKYVNAKVKAGGFIYIYGEPESIDRKTTFGGSIKEIN